MLSKWFLTVTFVVLPTMKFNSNIQITTTTAFTAINPTNGGHSRIGSKGMLHFQTTDSSDNAVVVPPTMKNGRQQQQPKSYTSKKITNNNVNSETINGSTSVEENGAPLSMGDIGSALYDTLDNAVHVSKDSNNDSNNHMIYTPLVQDGILPTADPSQIEFVTPDVVLTKLEQYDTDEQLKAEQALLDAWANANGHYPFAAMMQCSGPYIANHAGKIAVFHIPGDLFETTSTTTTSSTSSTPPNVQRQKYCDALLQDIALCWLLDMKIVIVAAVQYSTVHGNNDTPNNGTPSSAIPLLLAHECHNALKVTSQTTLRQVEEEAGFLRTELERKLNRCLRAHHHGGIGSNDHNDKNRAPEGNVVSGNFYTAHRFGNVRGTDYEYTGYACETHTKNIRQVLDNNDIVLLSTVGLSAMGELVNVNGYHLAATVAASLQASKVIYIASQGAVLRSKNDQTPIQELPVSFAESITSYHQVACTNMGFATFQNAKERLQDSSAVELLLHMAWSCWSVKNGTGRAHICNPSDGSVLEELFTSKNGANTCIYHDNEISSLIATSSSDDGMVKQQEWDDFFASASAQGQTVEYFM